MRPRLKTRRDCLLLPFALGACSVLPERPYQSTTVWPLVVPLPPMRVAARKAPVLLLRPVRAAAGLEPRGLQNLLADGSLHTDAYEEWAAQPADAVNDQLQAWLAASGLFSAVVLPGSRVTANYILEAHLTALWTVQAAAQAQAKLGYVLIDQRNGVTNVVSQNIVEGSAPLADDRPAARAAAEIAALANAFGALTAQLAAQRING